MRLHRGLHVCRGVITGAALAVGLVCCGGGSGDKGVGGTEPTENQMKEGMLYWMNHNPDGTKVAEEVKMKFFKKEACDDPTKQGFHCTFEMEVLSTNQLAGMYNNLISADFYKDKQSGEWRIRPPF